MHLATLQSGLPNIIWAATVIVSSRNTTSNTGTSEVSILSSAFSALVFHLQCFAIVFATITFSHLLCQHHVSASAFNHQLFHHMALEASATQHLKSKQKALVIPLHLPLWVFSCHNHLSLGQYCPSILFLFSRKKYRLEGRKNKTNPNNSAPLGKFERVSLVI